MNNNIYETYQGEDFEIDFKARDSYFENVDISDIEISVALINPLKNKIYETGHTDGMSIVRDGTSAFSVVITSATTALLPAGDYSISVKLSKNGKKAIEQIKLIRVIGSIHK